MLGNRKVTSIKRKGYAMDESKIVAVETPGALRAVCLARLSIRLPLNPWYAEPSSRCANADRDPSHRDFQGRDFRRWRAAAWETVGIQTSR